MHVIGGHHLDAQLLRYLEYYLVDLLLMLEGALLRSGYVGLVPLHLQIIVVTEDGLVPRRYALRLLRLSLHDGLRHLSAQTGRAADYTLVVLLYKLVVNARLIVEALDVSLGRELDEVVVAIHVLGQHDQMVGTLVLAALAVKAAVPRHIHLATHDRLQRSLFLSHRIQELLYTEHIAVIGNRQGRLTVGHGSIDQIPYLGLTVQNRILGMDMQVGE